MALFGLALVIASVVAAEPLNAGTWIMPNDYPNVALRQGRGGYVGFRLEVSKEGKPIRCDVTYSTGHRDVDAVTCNLLMRRALFEPARDATGDASAAVYRNSMHWWVKGMRQTNAKPPSSDLDLTVKRLPNGVSSPATATVAFAVAASGAISNCTPMLPQPSAPDRSSQAAAEQRIVDVLGSTACAYVQSNVKPQPATDEQGNSVSSVQIAKVQFVVEPNER